MDEAIMTQISPKKMTDRFYVQFDGFAQCSIDHNSDLTRHVLTASRSGLALSGWSVMHGTITLRNDGANVVLSKLIAQINRQKRHIGNDRPYFRLLMRDLLPDSDNVISTLTLSNCLITTVDLSDLDAAPLASFFMSSVARVNADISEQTITLGYTYETFDFGLGKLDAARLSSNANSQTA
jgi:hypothetical protein